MEIVAPPERLAVHTVGGTPVIGVPGMVVVLVEHAALVEEEASDEVLVRGVARVEGMAGKDHMDPLTGLHMPAIMKRAPRVSSTRSRKKLAPSKMNLMP